MSITLAQAETMLAEYLAAESAVLKGQSYTIKDRTLTRANLSAITKERKYWETKVDAITNGGSIRVRRSVPSDL